MTTLIIWITTIFLIVLIFLLAKLVIKKYFKHLKGRYDATKSNYISAVAITALLSAFFIINPTTSLFLINFSINQINRNFDLNINMIQHPTSVWDIVIYSILCISIIAILYVSYRHRMINYLNLKNQERESGKESLIINFPEQDFYQSPHLHLRIKELFELKYIRYNLILKETKGSDENKIIYGSYSDDFNTFFEIIYCDNSSNKPINIRTVENVQYMLESEIFRGLSLGIKNPIAHYYYITECQQFVESKLLDRIKCYTEDNFINTIVDFKPYLNKLKNNFEKDKLFSAILNEDNRKTLAETYIEPAFYIGGNKSRTQNNLFEYVSKWINDFTTPKQMVLLGDYGMGKTSFLKYLAHRLADDYLKNGNCSRFPVFVPLTNCSPMHGGIDKSIKSFVAENLGIDYSLFKRLVEKGKILFLLDAFDEMGFIGTKEQRFKQFNEIWQLAIKNNKILLTGRPSYFPSEFEMKQTLAIPREGHEIVQTLPYAELLTLSRLDDNRIRHYIDKYYPTMGNTYFKWIKSNSGLYELCKRPSMMHMIREMLEDLYNKDERTYVSAGDVMSKYIEYWINRQKSKNIQSAFHGNEPSKIAFINKFFVELATEFYLNESHNTSPDEIIKRIDSQIATLDLQGFDRKENKEGFHQELLTGYFIEREDDTYKFVHKSFFDFFVSSMIIALLKSRKFKHPLMFKTWNLEIIDFVYDTIPKNYINDNKIPALLGFSNSKITSYIKLFHFKLDAIFNVFMFYFYSYFLIVYTAVTVIIGSFYSLYFLKKSGTQDVLTSPKIELSYILIAILILVVFLGVFFIVSLYLDRIKSFTVKSIILSIIKNEPNSKKLVREIFATSDLTIRLSNMKINKIYPISYRIFHDSICENITFSNCLFGRTSFYGSSLKNLKFQESSISNLRIMNCQLENVNFSGLKVIEKFNKWQFPNPYYIFRIFSTILNRKRKRKDFIVTIHVTPNQIDEKTLSNLKDFITSNNLNTLTDIWVEEWILEKLGLVNKNS